MGWCYSNMIFQKCGYSCLPFPAAYCLKGQAFLPNCSLEINSQKNSAYGCFTSSLSLAPSQTTVLAVQFLSHFQMEVTKVTSPLHCLLHYWYGLRCPDTSLRVTDLVFFPLSQHDTTLVALQMALDVYNKIQAPYASCHLFELYQEDDGWGLQ